MNQLASFLQNIRWRQILTGFLAAITFFTAFNYGSQMQALAAQRELTPEATSYQVDSPNEAKTSENTSNHVSENSDSPKGIVENIREKLNLDEPTPPSTKKFFKQVEDKVDDVVEPITGK